MRSFDVAKLQIITDTCKQFFNHFSAHQKEAISTPQSIPKNQFKEDDLFLSTRLILRLVVASSRVRIGS